MVDGFSDVTMPRFMSGLRKMDAVIIPHGTLISEVGVDEIEARLDVPIFGSRKILRWEADRKKKELLMKESGIRTPKSFRSAEEIDKLAIVKMHGAKGGRGYFLADSPASYARSLRMLEKSGKVTKGAQLYIQEYVVGVPVYLQFFYSPVRENLELMGVERRYETNVDALGRLPASMQNGLAPSYVVVGNMPLVLRESLLDEVYRLGEGFVRAAKRLVQPGIIGPFCIEGVYDEEAEFVGFEFSARIVAGTNLYVSGSPYSDLVHEVPMSAGRRIAVELKEAMRRGSLAKVLT
jgi:5-formaminoimidazole-4-carboxamide-1-(beta)-D-ribofuranosyl 5'-monophosphate synthetase